MVSALVVQRPYSVGMLSMMWLFTVSWYAVLVVIGIRPYDVVGHIINERFSLDVRF